jgi:hypothetical protein
LVAILGALIAGYVYQLVLAAVNGISTHASCGATNTNVIVTSSPLFAPSVSKSLSPRKRRMAAGAFICCAS